MPLARLRDNRARERCIEYALNASAQIQQEFLIANPRTPPILKSGIRYRDDTNPLRDDWKTVPEILANRGGDCDDIIPWRLAELRLQGIPARPMARIQQRSDGLIVFHALIAWGNHTEDTCRLLGMPI